MMQVVVSLINRNRFMCVQVRHAQGIHNVAGEKDYNAYMSEELLDAQLTPLGWSQVSLRVSFSQVHDPCMPSSHRPWPHQFYSQRVQIVVLLLFVKYLLRWQCLLSFVDMIIAIGSTSALSYNISFVAFAVHWHRIGW
jgi:hypothetical protein